MAPQVRDLQNLIKTYSASFDPQRALIDQDITTNTNAGVAQEAGLQAKQTSAFKQIDQNAQNKGMFFSGFTPDAQASYTADTYLPALAQLQSTIAQTRSSLLGKKADLDSNARTSALAAQEGDRSAVNNWNVQQEQQRFQAQQAELAAQRAAAEAAKDRAASAANARLQASSSAASKPNVGAIVSSIDGLLKSKVGGDGKVSPNTFNQGLRQWVSAGGDPDSYRETFYGYVNTSHAKDYGL